MQLTNLEDIEISSDACVYVVNVSLLLAYHKKKDEKDIC